MAPYHIASVVLLPLVLPVALAAQNRPNIVLVLADDLGAGDLGCYNPESKIPTPCLDRIAAAGGRFTDMHSPSAVCTPTRYALLTGRYAWRSRLKRGVLGGYSKMLIEKGRVTLPALLKKHGYRTGGVGKWHLGLQDNKRTDYAKPLRPGPLTAGFDSFFGIPASLDMPPYVWVVGDAVEKAPSEKVRKSGHRRKKGGGFWRGGAVAPGFRHADVLPRVTKESEAFLERCASNKGQPFFLYVPLPAPHTPWMPTQSWRGKSKAGYYGDFVAMVDACIGRIDSKLTELGLTENTLLIVTSDNGSHWPTADIKRYGHRANLHYRGQKADIHEGGHRVPFLVRWPGKTPPGITTDDTGCLTDMLRTIAGIVGAKLPENAAEDSCNLWPRFAGQEIGGPMREATVHHSLGGMFAIRKGRWKLIEGRGSGGFTQPRKIKAKPGEPAGQLYDLRADPSETENLWGKRPKVVARMTAILDRYRREARSAPK